MQDLRPSLRGPPGTSTRARCFDLRISIRSESHRSRLRLLRCGVSHRLPRGSGVFENDVGLIQFLSRYPRGCVWGGADPEGIALTGDAPVSHLRDYLESVAYRGHAARARLRPPSVRGLKPLARRGHLVTSSFAPLRMSTPVRCPNTPRRRSLILSRSSNRYP